MVPTWHGHCIIESMSSKNNTDVLTCVIDMLFSTAQVEQAVQLLLSTIGRTKSKSGCKACLVGRDASDSTRVRYNEVWLAETSFRRHVRSEEFRRVLVAMDMSLEKPQVTVGTLSGRQGIAFLRDVHGGSEPVSFPEGRPEEEGQP